MKAKRVHFDWGEKEKAPATPANAGGNPKAGYVRFKCHSGQERPIVVNIAHLSLTINH